MSDWFRNFTSTLAAMITSTIVLVAAIIGGFLIWANTPLGEHMDIETVNTVTSQNYNLIWIPFVVFALIMAICAVGVFVELHKISKRL